MSDDKPKAWSVEMRLRNGERDSSIAHSPGEILREVEECLKLNPAYITISALYPLFGSDDLRKPADSAPESPNG